MLNWQRHAARRMILHFLEVDMFYQVGTIVVQHDGPFSELSIASFKEEELVYLNDLV